MTPTAEQQAIVDFALHRTESLLISALAGAAKTSTLQLICEALPPQPILSLAFNKRIAEAMTKRLPSHVNCRTLNSIGHRVWAQACSRRLVLETKKSYNILKEKVDALPRSQKSEAYETFSETLKAVGAAKLSGYVPEGVYPNAKRLIEKDAFWASFEEEPDSYQKRLVDEVLTASVRQSYDGLIDFDDQIYMPTLFGGTFPQFPLVLVDEAQDLSEINHAMLEKLVTRRLIAVGDPWQSIYGFRGAVASGMSRLRDTFNMQELGLSVSFRCPVKVVKRAWFRAPHMKWPEWAVEGQVEALETWDATCIPDDAAIICRNNAPLFKCALSLIRAGRGVQLVGSDLGPGLIKVLKKLGDPSLNQEQTYAAIELWRAERLKKSKAKGSIEDRSNCLRVFVSFGRTLGEAIAYAEHLFSAHGPIQLLSGHKAKGLEWDTVYHLDPWRIPSPYSETDEDREQELNVRYVIETRAKKSLFLVDLRTFGNAQQF